MWPQEYILSRSAHLSAWVCIQYVFFLPPISAQARYLSSFSPAVSFGLALVMEVEGRVGSYLVFLIRLTQNIRDSLAVIGTTKNGFLYNTRVTLTLNFLPAELLAAQGLDQRKAGSPSETNYLRLY